MQKEILLDNQNIIYTLKVSPRAKRLRLAIYCNGELVVTQPRSMSIKIVENFIKEHAAWIIKKSNYFKNIESSPLSQLTRRDYLNKREEVRTMVINRIEYFNHFYNFKYFQINIRNQKTRWGSCSRRGSLNFNFRLLYLPEAMRDYVIVHELCHLKELNHSARFWNLVAQTVPDFRDLKSQLMRIN